MKQVVYKLKCTVVGIDADRPPPPKKKLQETTINKQINLTYLESITKQVKSINECFYLGRKNHSLSII